MNRIRGAGRQTFRSLETPNYRKYIVGQIISASGSWVQQIGLIWLVARLTDNAVAVAMVQVLQFAPMLIGGAWAGVLADRMDKRRLLVATSAASAACAALLGVLVLADAAELWMVYVLAAAFGLTSTLDNPARRSFVTELVPDEHASNAVSLNTSVFTTSRLVGSTAAALIIATIGIGWCFVVNAVSFVAVIVALQSMDRAAIRPAPVVPRQRGLLVEGLRYVRSTPALFAALMMTAIIGTLSYNFQVTITFMAKRVFPGGSGTFGLLMALMSVGAVPASLFVAHRKRITSRFVNAAALVFGLMMLAAAVAPNLATFAIIAVPMGASSITFISSAGALAQSRAAPEYRGRVAALFAVAFLGSTPIGGPIVGAVTQLFGARYGMVLGGVTAVVCAIWATRRLRRRVGATTTAASVAEAAPA